MVVSRHDTTISRHEAVLYIASQNWTIAMKPFVHISRTRHKKLCDKFGDTHVMTLFLTLLHLQFL